MNMNDNIENDKIIETLTGNKKSKLYVCINK